MGSYSYVSATMNIIVFLMIVRIQNSIPQVKVTSSTIYIIASFFCSILKIKVWIKETTFLSNIYIYIFPCLQGNIRNIALHWPLICPRKVVHILVITQALVLCLIYTHSLSCIVHIHQAKHSCLCYNLHTYYTSSTLKSAQI